MKRSVLLLLAILVLVGVAGCRRGWRDADPVGTWSISWDTACDGIDGTRVHHIYPNGTLTDAAGNTANWIVVGDQITMTFVYGGIWSGTIVNDNAMTGDYSNPDGGRGCWSGTKISDTP